MTRPIYTTAILLAGGSGTRMQAKMPKQFIHLGTKPLALYSFDIFLKHPSIDEVIVVCPPEYQDIFRQYSPASKTVYFALPGIRRQDSVYHGFQASSATANLICIHDAARPFIDAALVQRVLDAGKTYGAAAAGMPVKFTVKESDSSHFVKSTPDRSFIWEIQTPQVLERTILEEGFLYANFHKTTVTDDASLAELIGKKVKLVEGSHINLKITVPSDLTIASFLLQSIKDPSVHA